MIDQLWTSAMRSERIACMVFAISVASTSVGAAQTASVSSSTPVSLQSTAPVCDLLGLGAIGSVPFNFPGADANALAAFRGSNPRVPEATLPAGNNPQVPRVLGGDLGAPFVHGDGRLYFSFGDTFPAAPEGIDPSFCAVGQETCQSIIYNDDILASAPLDAWTSPDDCIDLTIPRSAIQSDDALPITWNGDYSQGGSQLGPGIVPGPGFSTGRYAFFLMPGPTLTCTPSADDCAAVGGIEGDHCLVGAQPDQGRCYFGECAAEAQSPCALRLNAMTLAVGEQGSNLITPQIGTHIASQAVLDAYRGHFSTASFQSNVNFDTGHGVVWAVGRDSFWGGTGITMSPYLLFHPVSRGELGEARYFAGMNGDKPSFSSDRTQAKPIYAEDKVLTNHTSITYDATLAGGTWLMIYGGHQSPSLSGTVRFFVNPAPNDMFYGRDLGIYLRWAKHPWGPWSDAITIFNAYTPGQGGYCEKMYFDDPTSQTGFQCPFGSAAQNESLNRSPGSGMAGEYGAAFVPGYSNTSDSDHSYTFHWLLSTWNPYRVMLMKSALAIDFERDTTPVSDP